MPIRGQKGTRTVTPEQREELADRIDHTEPIWQDEDELDGIGIDGPLRDRNLRWWLDNLGHHAAHRGCCATCGCAVTCMASAFWDATVASVIRQLDRMGALVQLAEGNTATDE